MNAISRLLRCFRASSRGLARRAYRPVLDAFEPRWAPAISLGVAANFGVLGLQQTDINNRGAIVGDVGISRGGELTNARRASISGDVLEFARHQVSSYGALGGTVQVERALMMQADADARSAAAAAAGLMPTQSFAAIRTATTITGSGGTNVINVRGNITASLVLSGGVNDIFIVNVRGSLALSGNEVLGLAGGVTASHVLYNFTGFGGIVFTARVGNTLNGTLLAPNYSFDVSGTTNGALIGGGCSINIYAGARVNDVPFAPLPPPPPVTSLSGSVFGDTNSNGVIDTGDAVVSLRTVSLLDNMNNVIATAMTDGSGFYHFDNLAAGTYTVQVSLTDFVLGASSFAGTVNNSTDGAGSTTSGPSIATITGISLQTGNAGINYNFLGLVQAQD